MTNTKIRHRSFFGAMSSDAHSASPFATSSANRQVHTESAMRQAFVAGKAIKRIAAFADISTATTSSQMRTGGKMVGTLVSLRESTPICRNRLTLSRTTTS